MNATTNGNASHDSSGRPPEMSRNTNTGIRFSPRLISDMIRPETGTASRGKSILRTSGSRLTRHRTAPPVTSEKNMNSTIPSSSETG